MPNSNNTNLTLNHNLNLLTLKYLNTMAIKPHDFEKAVQALEEKIDSILTPRLSKCNTLYRVKTPDDMSYRSFEVIRDRYIKAGWSDVRRDRGTDIKEMDSWDVLIFEV